MLAPLEAKILRCHTQKHLVKMASTSPPTAEDRQERKKFEDLEKPEEHELFETAVKFVVWKHKARPDGSPGDVAVCARSFEWQTFACRRYHTADIAPQFPHHSPTAIRFRL